jgi:hypothetical protein
MDANVKDLRRSEVEDLDDEIYYREILGCTVKQEGSCATAKCPEGELSFCQKPGVAPRTDFGPSCGPGGCEDAC